MGTEIDFETDKNFNYEQNISMNIELKKTCYSKGEIIQGNLYLAPKTTPVSNILIKPFVEISLREHHYYDYISRDQDRRAETVKQEENVILFKENINFSDNYELNISNGYIIPFAVKVPYTAYPSCIFNSKSFVKHYLSITFPSIFAKRTLVIIIKNNIYFSDINGLLKSPVIINREITKHKYIFFNYGDFKISIVLTQKYFFL